MTVVCDFNCSVDIIMLHLNLKNIIMVSRRLTDMDTSSIILSSFLSSNVTAF